MTARKRSRASAKRAGADLELRVTEYLQKHVSKFVYKRGKQGAKDKGDFGNLFLHEALGGHEVTLEAKNEAKISLGTWHGEAERERQNAGGIAAVVVAKRHGKGDPADAWVHMTVRDLVAILTGVRQDVDISPEEKK